MSNDITNQTAKSDQEIADLSAKTMWESDRASQFLGLKLISCTKGHAVMTMTIREEMTNGHDITHGGFVFALADSTFAFACNSYGDVHVASHCEITYIRPTKKGDILTAVAREISRTGKNGLYDISIRADDKVIAEFRGHSRSLGRRFIEE